MEQNYHSEVVTQANKDVLLNRPAEVKKQLENLYKTVKGLQVYCIKINTTPNLNWQDFIKLYRKDVQPTTDNKIEQILLDQSLQFVLRKHTAEYLDKLNPSMNRVFDELLNFAATFVEFYPELSRSIEETIKGSQDKDYEMVIDELMKDVSDNKAKNDRRLRDLADFAERFTDTLKDLGLLKAYICAALKEEEHEIKQLEAAIKKLEDELEKNNKAMIHDSLQTKIPISFKLAKNNKDKQEKEKQKKTLQDKLAKLQAALSAYNQDYATLRTLYDAADRFAKDFNCMKSDISEVSQAWHSLEDYFLFLSPSVG